MELEPLLDGSSDRLDIPEGVAFGDRILTSAYVSEIIQY